MNGIFYIGATGLEAQQRALDVTANNIANINTPTFKRTSVRFAEMVAAPREVADILPVDSSPISTLAGVRVDARQHIWTQGDIKPTGSVLDIAIEGAGFIEVLGSDGQVRLWRGGTLKVSDDGFLATADGAPLRSMISVPAGASELTIAADGTVTAQTGGTDGPERLGRLELALIDGLDALTVLGGGYFESPENGVMAVLPGEEGGGRIVQGAIESSNVDLSEQMVSLMLLQRGYAANAQLVQAGDQIMAILNNLRK